MNKFERIKCEQDIINHYDVKTFQDFPIINERSLFLKIPATSTATWYILRELVSKNKSSGFIPRKIAVKIISHYLNLSISRANVVINSGIDVYYTIGNTKKYGKSLFLFSPKKIAKLFKINLPYILYLESNISVFTLGTKYIKAHLLKTSICKNKELPEKPTLTKSKELNKEILIQHNKVIREKRINVKPISKETITNRTKVSSSTQLRYIKLCNERRNKDYIYRNFNYTIEQELSSKEYYDLQSKMKEKISLTFKGERLGGKYSVRKFSGNYYGSFGGDIYAIVRQLPNSYSSSDTIIGKYFINKGVNDVNKKVLNMFLLSISMSNIEYEEIEVIELSKEVNPYIFNTKNKYRKIKRFDDIETFNYKHSYKASKHRKRLSLWESKNNL